MLSIIILFFCAKILPTPSLWRHWDVEQMNMPYTLTLPTPEQWRHCDVEQMDRHTEIHMVSYSVKWHTFRVKHLKKLPCHKVVVPQSRVQRVNYRNLAIVPTDRTVRFVGSVGTVGRAVAFKVVGDTSAVPTPPFAGPTGSYHRRWHYKNIFKKEFNSLTMQQTKKTI